MPFFDRYWWLRWLAAFYVAAGAAELAKFIQWDSTRWDPLATSGCFTCFLWVGFATAVGLVLWLAVGGFRARERKVRRMRAIRGDPDTIPLAQTAPDIARRWFISVLNARAETLGEPFAEGSARGRGTSDTFLTLQWRWSMLWQDASGNSYPRWRAIGLLALPFVICSSCSFASGLVAVYFATRIDLPGFIWLELPSLWIWPLFVFAIWRPNPRSVFLIPLRRSPFGITVDEEGIEERTRFGERHVVRWEDARLLEVRLVKEQVSGIGYQYILYSRRDAVRWFVDFLSPREYLVSDGMRRDEMESGHQLLYLIMARCGLLPRTFDRNLQATP